MPNKRAILTVAALLVVVNLTLGIRWFIAARSTKASNACVNNLRQIEGAKEQWALEQQKKPDAVPTWDDLKPYLAHQTICPEGGTYTLGRVGVAPTCSVGGPSHSVPATK